METLRTIDAVRYGLVSELVRKFGEARVRVTGSSMLPHLLPRDIVTVQRRECREFRKGDIALFSRRRRLFAHRVLATSDEGAPYLVTRGDSVSEDDPPVFPHEILGCVTSIVRGDSRITPSRLTFLSRAISALFRESQILTTVLLWLLNRSRRREEEAQCRA